MRRFGADHTLLEWNEQDLPLGEDLSDVEPRGGLGQDAAQVRIEEWPHLVHQRSDNLRGGVRRELVEPVPEWSSRDRIGSGNRLDKARAEDTVAEQHRQLSQTRAVGLRERSEGVAEDVTTPWAKLIAIEGAEGTEELVGDECRAAAVSVDWIDANRSVVKWVDQDDVFDSVGGDVPQQVAYEVLRFNHGYAPPCFHVADQQIEQHGRLANAGRPHCPDMSGAVGDCEPKWRVFGTGGCRFGDDSVTGGGGKGRTNRARMGGRLPGIYSIGSRCWPRAEASNFGHRQMLSNGSEERPRIAGLVEAVGVFRAKRKAHPRGAERAESVHDVPDEVQSARFIASVHTNADNRGKAGFGPFEFDAAAYPCPLLGLNSAREERCEALIDLGLISWRQARADARAQDDLDDEPLRALYGRECGKDGAS
ncbi:hypothetical protein GCM10027449_14730 [Sinomonas notoginsengisoli]